VNRSRKKESAVKVKTPKDFSFREEIWSLVEQCCESGQVPDCRPPTTALPARRESVGKVRPRQGQHFIFN
jgi:hypothetical protein